VLFTPDRGGRYSFLVAAAPRLHERQPYHLQVAPAQRDDTSPGLALANFARARGGLNGRGVDVVDLYRYDVTSRSELTLTLTPRGTQDFEVVLLNDAGARISSARTDGARVELRRLGAGRFFAAVRARGGARGAYTLRRVSRTSIAIAGGRRQTAPGAAVTIGVTVTPAVAGPVTIVIERFDPLAGYQFLRRVRVHATAAMPA
jgi:hypothetical protein